MKREERLEINEQTLPVIRQMAECMPGGFFICRADGNEDFLLFNHALLRMTGCRSAEEFKLWTGNSFRGLVHPEERQEIVSPITEGLPADANEEEPVEYRVLCPDGSERWFRDHGSLVHTDGFGDACCVFVEDAAEKYRREQLLQTALEEQEAQLQEIIELNMELASMQEARPA